MNRKEHERRKRTDSMTAPVAGSCGLPACTARVAKLYSGDGARGGVSMEAIIILAWDYNNNITMPRRGWQDG